MTTCTGEYINIYGADNEDYRDIYVIVNEANDRLTSEKVDATEKEVIRYKNGEIDKDELQLILEDNLFSFGVQIIENNN